MELFDLYDKNRLPLGTTHPRGTPIPADCYHMVVHVCIFGSDGRMLIQQRQPFKKGWSNMWDISVGGSAQSGDSSTKAAERECLEELGLVVDLVGKRPTLTMNFDVGFDDIYLLEMDVDPLSLTLQYEEVQAVRWATCDEIIAMIDSGDFIPYHKTLMRLLFDMRGKSGAISGGW